MKRISEMNLDTVLATGNSSAAISSNPGVHLPNGGCAESQHNYPNNDFSFPPGGYPFLRLPVVLASSLLKFYMHHASCL